MEPLWPVLLFAAVHIFIVLNVASVNSNLKAKLEVTLHEGRSSIRFEIR